MAKIVISLGGSVVCGKTKEAIKQLADLFIELSQSHQLAIVVGGGSKAKEYADAERSKGEFFADRAAIKATKENAELLRKALGSKASTKVTTTIDEAADAMERGLIPVSGGLLEGLTTDAVSVLIAERVHADRLVNASNVDAVYTANPKEDKNAKPIPRMTHQELVDLAVKEDKRTARTNFVFDLVAAKLAARSRIPLYFVDGNDLPSLKQAIEGKKAGTVVE